MTATVDMLPLITKQYFDMYLFNKKLSRYKILCYMYRKIKCNIVKSTILATLRGEIYQRISRIE